MSREFDPYHKWLGISPREQPPHHYRLLAIDLFEDDPEVIDSAANRQMSYLQELASGPNVRHAQNLLNEISAARVCLLDERSKADYDAKLKAEVGAAGSPPPSPLPPSPAPPESKTPLPPRPSAQPQVTPPPRDRGPVIDTGLGSGIAIDTRAATAPTRADAPRGAKIVGRPKSNNNLPIIVSAVLLVVLICSGIVFAVVVASNSTDENLAQQTTDSNRQPANPDRRERDDRDPRQSPVQNVTPSPVSSPESDIPEPGANIVTPSPQPPDADGDNNTAVNDDPAEPAPSDQPEVKPQDPRSVDPAPVDPPRPAGPPELLKQAYEALQRRDVEQVIAHLEKCAAENPPSPYKEEVEELLTQAKVAISPEEAKKCLAAWLKGQTDKQVQQMANSRQVRIDINQLPIPVKNNILKEVFLKTTFALFQTPEWPKLVYARLNPDDPQVAAVDPPAANEVEDPELVDDKPETPVAAPRPTDPAELLAAEGLIKDGGRWALVELEQELKEQLIQVTSLEDKVSDARNAVSPRQRAQLAAAQTELARRRAVAEKEHQDAIKGNLIEVRDQRKYEKRIAELAEAEKKINALAEQVTQADIAADAAIEELRPELDLLEKKVSSFEETQQRLSNDEEVLAAIESQGGGSFATSTVLKSAKSIAIRIRKAIGGGDNF